MGKVMVGDKVQDVLTGFQGTVIARTEYLYGSTHIAVQGELSPHAKVWLDEAQVRLLESGSKK